MQNPTGGGSGTALIESAIPGATVKREFRADGLACTIELELPEAADNETAGRS